MNQRPLKHHLTKSIGTAACLLAVLAMLGGHWLALQSLAWARMLRHYARQESLASALAKTFDGRHPCALCKFIQNGRQHEEQAQKGLPLLELRQALDLVCDDRRTPIPPPPVAAAPAVPFVPHWHPGVPETPPAPPPRAA